MADRLKRLRSEVHRHQWRQTLQDYAYPIIGNMPVNEIETNDVLAVLKPIWETKCETAARLRGRMERILARATVEGLRRGANPATWRGHLQEALPPRSEVQPVKHFRAMDYQDVPAFMAELGRIGTVSAVSLRFLDFHGRADWRSHRRALERDRLDTRKRGQCRPLGPKQTRAHRAAFHRRLGCAPGGRIAAGCTRRLYLSRAGRRGPSSMTLLVLLATANGPAGDQSWFPFSFPRLVRRRGRHSPRTWPKLHWPT